MNDKDKKSNKNTRLAIAGGLLALIASTSICLGTKYCSKQPAEETRPTSTSSESDTVFPTAEPTETLVPTEQPSYEDLFEDLYDSLVEQDIGALDSFINLPYGYGWLRTEGRASTEQTNLDSKQEVLSRLEKELRICNPIDKEPEIYELGEDLINLEVECYNYGPFIFGVENIGDRPYITRSLLNSFHYEQAVSFLGIALMDRNVELASDFIDTPYLHSRFCGSDRGGGGGCDSKQEYASIEQVKDILKEDLNVCSGHNPFSVENEIVLNCVDGTFFKFFTETFEGKPVITESCYSCQ